MMKCNLKEILYIERITQVYLADQVEIHKTTMARIVNEKTDPSLKNAYRIAKFLNRKIEDIWYEDE
ncbi:helix-turn-helix domain-containing protein [Bacillus gobiensis]|uniref:helix-turn-helix transcriptional regulator n=1 Tax=Bacillus gobiensis TaxID=1441095 RepID=UPI003D201E40